MNGDGASPETLAIYLLLIFGFVAALGTIRALADLVSWLLRRLLPHRLTCPACREAARRV